MVTSDNEAEQSGDEPNSSDDEYLPENPVGPRDEQEPDSEIMDIDIVEEEEEKPKPVLGLTYQGFNLYGQCLCVVVEPWPVVRVTTTPLMLSGHGAKSQKPSSNAAPVKEPLFLPEDPEDYTPNAAKTSAQDVPVQINKAYLDQVLHDGQAVDDPSEGDNDMGGMMEFSQIIYYSGDVQSGAIHDDDADESILFGDADEIKEL